MGGEIEEIELGEDAKALLVYNEDVKISPELKKAINESDDADLLKLTMSIGSPIKIIGVEKVTIELIEQKLQ